MADILTNPPERDSERAMREVRAEHPRRRNTTPTGGPDHPFVDGVIALTVRWDNGWELRLVQRQNGQDHVVPHGLTIHEQHEVNELAFKLGLIVYRAQWRRAHPVDTTAISPTEEEEDA